MLKQVTLSFHGLSSPALCQGAFMEGDESPQKDKAACFSIVWVLARDCSCTTTWKFVVF